MHWNTCREMRGREPAPVVFALICVTMSDAAFCKLIKSNETWWTARGCGLLEKDIDVRRADGDGRALYNVRTETKAAPWSSSEHISLQW